MDLTAERIGENQSRFREANEKIEEAAVSLGHDGSVPFLCECPNPRCVAIIRLSLVEYETVRASPTRFFVEPGHGVTTDGHDEPVADRVFATNLYEVFEKVGRAGEIAADADRRDR